MLPKTTLRENVYNLTGLYRPQRSNAFSLNVFDLFLLVFSMNTVNKNIIMCNNPPCNKAWLLSNSKSNQIYCSRECKERHFVSLNRENMNEYLRKYRKTLYGKERLREGHRKWRANPDNKIKIQAHISANKKFKKLKICSISGCNNIGEKHHPDYSKPFDIVFLCTKHHKFEHRIHTDYIQGSSQKHESRGLIT